MYTKVVTGCCKVVTACCKVVTASTLPYELKGQEVASTLRYKRSTSTVTGTQLQVYVGVYMCLEVGICVCECVREHTVASTLRDSAFVLV